MNRLRIGLLSALLTASACATIGNPSEQVFTMPAAEYVAPTPSAVVHVPGDGKALANGRYPLVIELAELPADFDHIDYRRLEPTDRNRLSLEIRSSAPFAPKGVAFGEWSQQLDRAPNPSLFLDLPAFVGYYDVRIGSGNRWRELAVPASSIALDGPRLYLNGDEFLGKGALMHWGKWEYDVRPSARTSFLFKNMGVNTVLTPPSEYYEEWGFASIRRANGLTIPKNVVQEVPVDTFFAVRDELVQRVPTRYREYISSPMDIASFFSNETTRRFDEAANARGEIDEYGRLNSYLARMHNAAKEVSPMMPTSYANHMPGFRPSPWLDIIMQNSYYYHDRYDESLEAFAAFQGFPSKPIFHKEFSANTYLDEIYQGGVNNPVFGKIRQWAFTERWQDYMAIGSMGGGIYTAFDYKGTQADRDGNTASFGFFTAEEDAKLIGYGVWNDYVDLVFDAAGFVTNRRHYPLRGFRLLIVDEDGPRLIQVDSLAAGERLAVHLPEQFYWAAQFDTNAGLLNQEMGAFPDALFQDLFSSFLPENRSTKFMERLLDTEVIGWDGKPDRFLMDRFKDENNVISVAFRRAPGRYYLTAWKQENPGAAGAAKDRPTTLTFFDTGEARLIDDITGEPIEGELHYEKVDGKLVFHDLVLPRIGRSIRQRSETPISLPVIEVSKTGFAEPPLTQASPFAVPDQFQLWSEGSVAIGDGRADAVAQRITHAGDRLHGIILRPLASTGTPDGDVTVRLHVAGADGTPGRQLAERMIASTDWNRKIDGLIEVNLDAALDPASDYLVVITAPGTAANHRNLASAGFRANAVTPSYGPGGLMIRTQGAWASVAAGKESLFFVTLSNR